MTCEECTERARLLAASEQILAEKRFKYGQEYRSQVGHPIIRARLLGSYEHAVKTARANLDRHRAECAEVVWTGSEAQTFYTWLKLLHGVHFPVHGWREDSPR